MAKSKSRKKIKKKVLESDRLYKSMDIITQRYAREFKRMIQKHCSTSIVEKSELPYEEVDFDNYNYLRDFDLSKEIECIENKIPLDSEIKAVTNICRSIAHVCLLSKIDYNDRVKYIKSLSSWENENIIDSVDKIMKYNNNYITEDQLEELLYDAEVTIYNEYFEGVDEELKNTVIRFEEELRTMINTAIRDMLVELAFDETINVQLLGAYSFIYLAENYKGQKIVNKVYSKLIDFFDEDLGYLYESEIEELNRIWTVLLNECNIDELENKNKSSEFVYRSWKELESIALKAGYEYVRSNGDHGIYTCDKKRFLVIPRGREIGKGLQIAIMKRIQNRR